MENSVDVELKALAVVIADEAARSDIETLCVGQIVRYEPVQWWYDTTTAESEEDQRWVSNAVRYLELRGLLVRHPERPVLVRPLSVEA